MKKYNQMYLFDFGKIKIYKHCFNTTVYDTIEAWVEAWVESSNKYSWETNYSILEKRHDGAIIQGRSRKDPDVTFIFYMREAQE